MPTIKKRGNKYQVQIRIKGSAPETATFERLSDAKEWAAKTESDMRAKKHYGQSKRRTFNELADEYEPYAKDVKRLNHWRTVFGEKKLEEVTAEIINKEITKMLEADTPRYSTPATGNVEQDEKRENTKRTGSTINRYVAALSVCLTHAVKLEWIDRNPCERINKPKENSGRVRFLSVDEIQALKKASSKHDDLLLAVLLSLATGARQAEIMGLRYSQIDFVRELITLDKTKNGDKRVLPLVGESLELLRSRQYKRKPDDDRVFPPSRRAGKSDYINLRKPWEAALKEAGIENFHWHDLRHTAASHLAMSKVSLVEIAKILGHKTLAMVARYAHLNDEHIVNTGKNLAERMGI